MRAVPDGTWSDAVGGTIMLMLKAPWRIPAAAAIIYPSRVNSWHCYTHQESIVGIEPNFVPRLFSSS